jgi:DNA-binding HxlR family transcriptional regulator
MMAAEDHNFETSRKVKSATQTITAIARDHVGDSEVSDMLKQADLTDMTRSSDLLEVIESRWTLRILLCLRKRDHRFSDIRLALPGLSANILTARMRMLEDAGLVQRKSLPPPAARQVYELAPFAEGLFPVLDLLADWRTALP